MQNSKNEKNEIECKKVDALRTMSNADFRAMGAKEIVYTRDLNLDQVTTLIPDLELVPGDVTYHVLFAANGEPIMLTDQTQAIEDWFDDHDAQLAVLN